MAVIKRRGLMLVLSSPSGGGKTTLAKMLLKADRHICTSISVTTRKPRSGEVEGVDYFFTDHETFKSMVQNDELLEHAEVFGNHYGIPRQFVENKLKNGQDVLFVIDWQGNRCLSAIARDDVVSVFIFPPSKQELLSRLRTRAQDGEDVISHRIQKANEEISHWHEYDYSIINKNLGDSLRKLLSILRAERLRKNRRLGVSEFVRKMIEEEIF